MLRACIARVEVKSRTPSVRLLDTWPTVLVRLVGGVAATRRAAATRRSDASCRASLTPQTHVSKSRSDKPRLLRILYFFDSSTCRSDSSDFGREKSRPRDAVMYQPPELPTPFSIHAPRLPDLGERSDQINCVDATRSPS